MDKNYWSNVLKAQEEIYNMMMELGIETVRNHNTINPFYNQIVDNGGIGLECSYGTPHCLYTPLGYLDLTADYVIGMNEAEKSIIEKLTTEYGAVLVEAESHDAKHDSTGPIYALTKLPWSDEELPVFEYKARKDYIGYDEANKLYEQFTSEATPD